jgi:hypothetical protein
MEIDMFINALKWFHEQMPDAKVDSLSVWDHDNGHMIRLYWFTDNDGGHADFYC